MVIQMRKRKRIWETLDELEGKEKGSSFKALQKEMLQQGYIKKKRRR